MKSNSRVYVIGHKNPDTDSICSAIAYADIKNRTDKTKTYMARRAGQINEETEYVLKRFGVRAPGYLPNAGTQVKEIEIHEVPSVPGTISVKKAYSMMKNNNVVTLPITSPDNDLQGVITVSDIAESYMDSYDSHVMSLARSNTAVSRIRWTDLSLSEMSMDILSAEKSLSAHSIRIRWRTTSKKMTLSFSETVRRTSSVQSRWMQAALSSDLAQR